MKIIHKFNRIIFILSNDEYNKTTLPKKKVYGNYILLHSCTSMIYLKILSLSKVDNNIELMTDSDDNHTKKKAFDIISKIISIEFRRPNLTSRKFYLSYDEPLKNIKNTKYICQYLMNIINTYIGITYNWRYIL